MLNHAFGRLAAIAAIAAAPALAGDYDRIFDVVKETWPARDTVLAVCNMNDNQLALLDLAETAKTKGFSLMIMDLRADKDFARTLSGVMARDLKRAFVVLIDEDTILGVKGTRTNEWITRLRTLKGVPTVAGSEGAFKAGAALWVPASDKDVLKARKLEIERMDLKVPAKAVDAK
ncbi:MAG TPA: hypothetical protein VK188_02135 [Holophaga sp.]|nr:hypothetical protein [Holophaga sp.]